MEIETGVSEEERRALRGRDIQQLLVLEFTGEDGREWIAGATITRLRLVGGDPILPVETRQIEEGDGVKLTGIKVVT